MLTKGQLPRFSAYAPLHTQITAERMNALVDGIEANRLMPGVGTRLQKSAQGVAVNQINQLVADNPIYVSFPLGLNSSGGGEVGVGSINGIIPTGRTIANGTFTISNTVYVWIATTWASGAITTAAITASTSLPSAPTVTQGTPPTTLDVLLYYVRNLGEPERAIGFGNIVVTPYEAFRTDKTPPLALGERPFNSWYGYQVTTP
jgi:hypothetical protein